MTRDFRKIKAWQNSKKFALVIYKFTKSLPREETYGLTSQIRRAAVSVPTNIAEGASRQHKRDYLNFLYTAKASLSEVECLISICKDLEYLDKKNIEYLENLYLESARTLFGLIRSVENEVRGIFSSKL